VLQRVDEQQQLVILFRERKARWTDHVMHGDTVLKDIPEVKS